MKMKYVLVAVLVFLTLLAVITNPDQDRHKEVIKKNILEYLQQSMDHSDNEWEQTGQALGMILGGAIVDKIIDNLVTTDNYVLFSISKITWNGETKVIGIGAFGNVMMTRELQDALDTGLLEKQK
jgi:hypothetical protein